jgi:hypothetical protein
MRPRARRRYARPRIGAVSSRRRGSGRGVEPTDGTKTGQGGGPGLSEDDRSATFEASEENRSRPLACIGLLHYDGKPAAEHDGT